MNKHQREVIEDRVRRGFDLMDQIRPGWWRQIELTENINPRWALRIVGEDRFNKAAFGGKRPSQLDRWMYGLVAAPTWVKERDLEAEWKRQIEHARKTGTALPPARPADQLLECALCGAPRWDNETIRRVDGHPVCDPTCPPR